MQKLSKNYPVQVEISCQKSVFDILLETQELSILETDVR